MKSKLKPVKAYANLIMGHTICVSNLMPTKRMYYVTPVVVAPESQYRDLKNKVRGLTAQVRHLNYVSNYWKNKFVTQPKSNNP